MLSLLNAVWCLSLQVPGYEIHLHLETILCLQKKDFVVCHMFQLFFIEKLILSELDICLLPGLLEKKLPFVRRTNIMSDIRSAVVLVMGIFPSTLQQC